MKKDDWVAMLLCVAMLIGVLGACGTGTERAVSEATSATEAVIETAEAAAPLKRFQWMQSVQERPLRPKKRWYSHNGRRNLYIFPSIK